MNETSGRTRPGGVGLHRQTIVSPSGERLVVVPEAEFDALIAAAEDASDAAAVRDFRRKLAAGEEELVPASVVERILSGDSPVAAWRSHRNMTSKELAERAGIAQAYVSQIETGKREGSVDTMRKIADALSVSIDDLVA